LKEKRLLGKEWETVYLPSDRDENWTLERG